MQFQGIISELKRRNVFRVATAYAIAGWLIIQICATTFPFLNLPEWLITAVIIFVLIGFPLSIIFAWAFELTQDGLRKSTEVDITESVTNRTGKKLNGIIITVLSMAVIFLLVERVFFAESAFIENQSELADVQTASIAVLPFVNMSSDKENEYFSDGLSEELLNALAKIKEMKVAGRTSSFKFKGQNENLSSIALELGVAYILEGSVRKAGNQVRITAQLIKAEDGYHMWSETYDREMTTEDIFNIQEEITGHVVDELKIQLLPGQESTIVSRPTDNLEAYNAYLKATQVERTLTPAKLEEAISYYEKAVKLDPDFSEAYARMAIAYVMLYRNGNISIEYTREKMKENIDQAVLSDINSGKVYHALGYYHGLNGDGEKAAEAITKAAELLPNDALVITSFARLNNSRYRNKENSVRINKAYELDPDHPIVATEYASYLYWIDQFEESIKLLDEVIAVYPEFTDAYDAKIAQMVDAPYGEIDEAFKIAYTMYQKHPFDVNVIGTMVQISTSLRLNGLAEEIIKKMRKDLPDNPSLYKQEEFLYFSTKDTSAIADLKDRIMETYNLTNESGDMPYYDLINAYSAGNYEKGLEIIERLNPEFKQGVQDEEDEIWRTGTYSLFLNKSGNLERSRYFADIFCNRANERIEPLPDETYQVNDNWIRLSCQLLRGDFEEAKKNLRTLYFEQNSKANWDFFNTGTLARNILFEQPEFDDLIAEIDADIARMRNNAVEYLKAEGEWKEEWEIEEN